MAAIVPFSGEGRQEREIMPLTAEKKNQLVRGLLFVAALGFPILLGIAFHSFSLVSLGSLGAMFALFIAPRYTPLAQMASISLGGLLVLLTAALGIYLQGRHDLALIPLFLLSWLAALPRPDQAYLSLLIKYMASAALLTFFGFVATPAAALVFLGGIVLGGCLSLAGMRYGGGQGNGASPLEEFRDFWHGATNGRLFGVAVPLTVLLCTLAARHFNFSKPAWVGLTVLYVMHSDGATELRRIWDRALGTMGGVLLAGAILFSTSNPLLIGLCIALAAFCVPFVQKGHYLMLSFTITCIVLLLIDISMLETGGDLPLLGWRLVDTLLACLGVLISNLILRLIHRLRGQGDPPAEKTA